MRDLLGSAVVGVVFGFALSRIGFSSWDEVHAMFTFANLRLTLAFGLAVAVLSVAWPTIRALSTNKPVWPPRRLHPGTIAGGLIFGTGWAISGACPSIALVQIGEGQLAAIWTLLGILGGNFLYAAVHERWFRWTSASCVDE
jgi:uncharacterized membrane protein YedE/YeeE